MKILNTGPSIILLSHMLEAYEADEEVWAKGFTKELGLTFSIAVKMFEKLDDAGLVTWRWERPDGENRQGKGKKLFKFTPSGYEEIKKQIQELMDKPCNCWHGCPRSAKLVGGRGGR